MAQKSDEINERYFASIVFSAEHAFAEKSATHRNAIKAADKIAAIPCFN